MPNIIHGRYPLISSHPRVATWLQIQENLQLAKNTIEAYGRALEDYLAFSLRHQFDIDAATREHLALYVRDLSSRPNPRNSNILRFDSGMGLSNATIQQRLTAVRLYYDYLIEEGLRTTNPVGRGRYTPGKAFGGTRERGLLPRYGKLPWIPTEDQWQDLLTVVKAEPLRNQVMFALAYDAGLRREELCLLETNDIDPSQRLIRVRATTTKNRQERIVPYSVVTSTLYSNYLAHRRTLSTARGHLFLSESHRNKAQPISIWTWSKAVQGIAQRADVVQFTTHTLRHLCLTDLARAGWDIHEIARFAGHRSTDSTLIYIHLSGRDLAEKLERSMNSLHAWRIHMLAEVLG